SPDGKTLAAGGLPVFLWDVANGKPLRPVGELDIRGIADGLVTSGVHTLAFSPDGKSLAVASTAGAIDLWEAATGQERCRFHGHQASFLAFSPDGRRLATAGEDATVVIWDVTGLGRKEGSAGGDLSPREVEGLWHVLADSDAHMAHRAIWRLTTAP